MKKYLACKADYKKIQSDEINKVITQLKIGVTTEEDANVISRRLSNSLENGRLNLSCCKISDKILNQILPLLSVLNITTLDLNSNDIRDEGAKALAKELKINDSLTHLVLWCNSIGDEGATALAKALNINESLTELNIWNNKIRTEGAKALAKELEINEEIADANERLISLKYHLILILNSKSETNIARLIVPVIVDYLRYDCLSDEARQKLKTISERKQQQTTQLASNQVPEPPKKIQKLKPKKPTPAVLR